MNCRFTLLALLGLALCPVSLCAAQKIVLVAGGDEDRTDIPAIRARLLEPFGVDFDAKGDMFIIEMASGNRLLKTDSRGILHHVAGQTSPGDAGDNGPAAAAKFSGPHNLAVLPDGNVLIADHITAPLPQRNCVNGAQVDDRWDCRFSHCFRRPPARKPIRGR